MKSLGQVLGCLAIVIIGWTSVSMAAEDPAAPPPLPFPAAGKVRELADHCLQCTVGISCRVGPAEAGQSYFGTGAVITAEGHIVTSTTVVPAGAEAIQVMFPGFKTREAKLVEVHQPLETTIIKVEGEPVKFLPIARELPQVGETAFTLSNAHNVLQVTGSTTFSMGLISGIYHVADIGGESTYAGLAVETSAAVNPGSDGGPIINEAGQVCGVISLNVSPVRWQGVGVPTKLMFEQMASLRPGVLPLHFEPLPGRTLQTGTPAGISRLVQQVMPTLATIAVERKYPAEVLPRVSFDQFRKEIDNWDGRSPIERAALSQFYFDILRLVEVNQMLRRPGHPTSGVVVSADGYVLTSAFNVEEDAIFLANSTDQPFEFKFPRTPAELKKDPEGGLKRAVNPVQKIMVTLADGSHHEARIVGQHLPMGIALLKIEKAGIPFLDLGHLAAVPELGVPALIVGVAPGGATPYTINSGIVSAPHRNRGFQWQTDALLNYGNSGGPVLDDQGRFLGLASRPIEPRTVQGRFVTAEELPAWNTAPNSGVSMIARSDRIVEILDKLKVGESIVAIPGPYMGIGPDQNRVFGKDVFVGSVQPGSPAAQAGLKEGDQLLSIDGHDLDSWKDMIEHLMNYKPGDKIELLIRRPGSNRRIVVNGKSVANEAELKELLGSLQPGEKFEGILVQEDTRTIPLTLGER
ncbi:MAG: PDZ domain-containing protein [Planctomycetes bacterium]|nr:PDZ domain-containing protein [Planctomycetota bacterium]